MIKYTVSEVRDRLVGKTIEYDSAVKPILLRVLMVKTINNSYALICVNENLERVPLTLTRHKMYELIEKGHIFLSDAIFIGIKE